jgi:Holliday junction resolvase
MGAMQRRKGKVYEREVARILRAEFPTADVRRTSQADRAGNSDVIVTGAPLLEQLWLELNDARDPNPLVKLQQAEHDIELARPSRGGVAIRLPVVIWHRIRERSHQVTTRLWVLDAIRGCPHGAFEELAKHGPLDVDLDEAAVTLDLCEFIAILKALAT